MTFFQKISAFFNGLFAKPDGTYPPVDEQPGTDLVVPTKQVIAIEDPHWFIPSLKVKSSRNVPKELETLIDAQLEKLFPLLFRAAVTKGQANRIVWMAVQGLEALHIREKTNSNDGYLVEMIQKVTGGKKGDAWCMFMFQTAVGYAERKTGKVSKVYASGSCASVRLKTPKELQISVTDSHAGCAWIWLYETGTGHVGTFVRWVKQGLVANLIEGNTTQGLSGQVIVREGGGCYLTERSVKPTSSMKLAMVLNPFGEAASEIDTIPTNQVTPPEKPVVKELILAWGKGSEDRVHWTEHLVNQIPFFGKDLLTVIPADDGTFGHDLSKYSKTQRAYFYAHLISIMAKYESNFKTASTFEESGSLEGVTSRGLLQISFSSANGYGAGLKDANELHDPKRNLTIGIIILNRWVQRDERLAGKIGDQWAGGARYWSVLRDRGQDSYKGIVAYMKTVKI